MSNLEANRHAASEFFRLIWNEKDESAIDRFIAVDAAGNDPKFGVGRESFRKQWKEWHAAFPNLHFDVREILCEGDRVVTRWHLTGTHSGTDFQGIKASGKSVAVDGVSIDTIKDGVVLDGFDAWDSLGFRQQLGVIPAE